MRRAWQATVLVGTAAAAAALLLAVIGHALRDRVAALAVLTYLPAVPIVAGVAAWDLLHRGRSLGRWRFGLSAAAVIAGAWFLWSMTGRAETTAAATGGERLRVVQWNVWWGGGSGTPGVYWDEQMQTLLAEEVDLIVLSEAPPESFLQALDARLPGWSRVAIDDGGDDRYLYHLAVVSRHPVTRRGVWRLPEGVAMLAEVSTPGATVRVLAVDGVSAPWRDRRRMLGALMELVAELEAKGTPADLLAGDFNAPARSVGFDALRGAGYRLTSESCGGWRGTWPSILPLYDLDHVWYRRDIELVGCTLFDSPHTDHRGQRVTLLPPRTEPE